MAIQRLRLERRATLLGHGGETGDRGDLAGGVAEGAQGVTRAGERPPGRGAVAHLASGVGGQQLRQCRRPAIARTGLAPCGQIQEAQAPLVVLAQQQQHATALVCLSQTCMVSRLPEETLRAREFGVRLREPAELDVEIGLGQCQPGAQRRPGSARRRVPFRRAQGRDGALQVPGRGADAGQIAAHRDRFKPRTRALVDRERLGKRRDRRRVITARVASRPSRCSTNAVSAESPVARLSASASA